MSITKSNEVVQILVTRDGISVLEAIGIVEDLQIELNAAADDGANICDLEEILADSVGLEPDYLMDLLFT